ncbi:hypothetical protein SRABI133_02538 [Peribacillus simplex]|uniref:Uncharacterized protein n=1 Tax=Peribacillus simplex TaxID=1478 RepID=A0A9W4KX02_9BACI|nr:hypothetical protein SRABI133_02538 [Peribacillus simplex]
MIIAKNAGLIMLETLLPDSKKHILNSMRVPAKKVDPLYIKESTFLNLLMH